MSKTNTNSVIFFFKDIRKTLFLNLINTIITFLIIVFISVAFFNTFEWLIFKANWKVVILNLPLYAFGSFPPDEQWRPATWIISLLLLSIFTLCGPEWKWLRKNLLIVWVGTIPLGLYLLYGGLGLSPIMSRHWGGLTLTILLTACSSILSLPLGIVLALCRQSSLPLIQKVSSIYIDVMRAIPLLLFFFLVNY